MSELDSRINTDFKSASILVVDDEEANVRLIEKILHSKGFKNVICTQKPLEVMTLLTEHHSDLLILDLNMPLMDGYDVMEKIKQLPKKHMPSILVLTAQDMQDFRQRALDSGARDYVTKPFDMNELISRVRNLLEVQMAHKYMRNQNEILEQKVWQRTQDLHKTRLQVVYHLGRAAEYRDNETGLHIIRMSEISALLGKKAGMSDYECELLLHASPMHDIGKIGIPDNILLKPGKLNEKEWRVMQTHAQIGADILSGDDSDLMKMAHDIALTHHEKFNGEGYPNNLQGDAIPLVGRITAIADVFDALTSQRPYKKEWAIEKTIELIKQESSKHFDPELVSLFIEILPGVLEIKEKYSE